MGEREINIVDLMVEILLHWRMFIIWMIGGAVFLGALSYVRSGNAAKQQQTQSGAMMQEMPEKWFTKEEIRNVNYAAACEKAYLEKEYYRAESPLMQLDSNHVNKAEATIAVISEDSQLSCDITEVYKDIVESGEFITKVAESIETETVGVSELLYLDNLKGQTKVPIASLDNRGNINIFHKEESGSGTFKIIAVYYNEEKCKAMLDSAVAFIMEKQPDIADALGEHEVSVVNESFGIVSDMEVAGLQEAVLYDITTMKKNASDAKKELSDKELQYYEYLMNDTSEGEEETVLPVVSVPGVSIKYVLLGALMAAFIYAFILLLVYIFNTKVRATDSMQELYGLPQLGMIPAAAGKKKVLSVVDKWIVSLRDRNKRQFTPEEALELAAVAAKMAAGKEGLQEICLMGCGLKERSLEVCGKIKARLEEEGIHTVILNNVLYDAQMLGELEGVKGAVLVESAGSTLYNEIAEELELLTRQGIKTLGGILVE